MSFQSLGDKAAQLLKGKALGVLSIVSAAIGISVLAPLAEETIARTELLLPRKLLFQTIVGLGALAGWLALSLRSYRKAPVEETKRFVDGIE